MAKQTIRLRSFLQLSLAARVALLLIAASLLPLLTMVVSSEMQSRPVLINQAGQTIQSDASIHVQLIEQFFHEQFALGEAVGQNPAIQEFLLGDTGKATDALNVLNATYRTNVHFQGLALFNLQGGVLLASPTVPVQHGQYLFPPDDLHQIIDHPLTLVSPTFYDSANDRLLADLYVPVQTLFARILGIVRITLNIDYIQELVTGELNANGQGSYAFILDQYGVRIADSNPTHRFSAIAPLAAQIQQRIQNEAIYGRTGQVQIQADPALVAIQQSAHPSFSFQFQPTGQGEAFQATRIGLSVVPWSYFVLAPLKVETAIADQQLLTTLVVATLVLLIAIMLGLVLGQSLAHPLSRAVEALNTNNKALNTLAERQRRMANEEQWMVDASHVGMHSVDYYTEVISTAARSLHKLITKLLQDGRQLDPISMHRLLQHMHSMSQYIENAASFQQSSNQKLMTAIQLTQQVSKQLVEGAAAATDAATQEEQVVKQLQDIVR